MKRILQAVTVGKLRYILAGFLLLSSASAAALDTETGLQNPVSQQLGETDKVYKIGLQNLLQIKILGEDTLQQTYRVDDFGFITHPLAGRVKIAGLTVADAEKMLESTLKGDYIRNPHITIFVLEHSRFSVLGEVRQPGNYEIIGQISIVEAISIAGGFTPVANEKKVHILRKQGQEEKTIEVDVDSIMQGKENKTIVQAGDVIHVPKSFF